MIRRRIIFVILFAAITGLYMASCTKQESVYQYRPQDQSGNATEQDTVLSVSALLNQDSFSALGRALQPDSVIKMSFYDFGDDAFLEIFLAADTPGTYAMGRSISNYTAVYYPSLASKQAQKGFTSRATDSAGGYVKIIEIDRKNHKIKGEFELLLLSRTDSARYDFKSGSFDILYNYGVMKLGDSLCHSVNVAAALKGGTSSAPVPNVRITFPDSVELAISINYIGAGSYNPDGTNAVMTLTDRRLNKKYNAVSGALNIIRFNYGEFIQSTFNCKMQAEDGTTIEITGGSFAIGNI